MMDMARQRKIGVALGGGVVRSFANIGVLNALLRERVSIDVLTGSSAASIIGAIYASGVSIEETNRIALHTRREDVVSFSWKTPWRGLFSNERLSGFLARHCRCKFFEEFPRAFGVVAADVMSGEERLFVSGEIIPAVRASCSIPGLFPPVRIGTRLYMDGCVVNQIPAEAARRMGADIVIGCDVSRGARASSRKAPRTMLAMWQHVASLYSQRTAEKGRRASDLVIAVKVDDIRLADFRQAEELIRRGEAAAELALPRLRHLLSAP